MRLLLRVTTTIAVLVATAALFATARDALDIRQATFQVLEISREIERRYANAPSYRDASVTLAPAQPDSHHPTHPWGGPVAVEGHRRHFLVLFAGLNGRQCRLVIDEVATSHAFTTVLNPPPGTSPADLEPRPSSACRPDANTVGFVFP